MGIEKPTTTPFDTERSIQRVADKKGNLRRHSLTSEGREYSWGNKIERVEVIREGSITKVYFRLLRGTLLFLTITMIGCQPSARLISANQTQPDLTNQIDQAIDIFILGNLVVEYHKENRSWPNRVNDLSFYGDTLKLFLTNFDTVSFSSNNNLINVDYKLSEQRKFLTPIEFIDPDSVPEEQIHIIWQELYAKSFKIMNLMAYLQ